MAERHEPHAGEPGELPIATTSPTPPRRRRGPEIMGLGAVVLLAVVLGVVALVATSSRKEPTTCEEVMDPYFETPEFARLHPELAKEQTAHDGELCLTAPQKAAVEVEEAESQATAPTVKPGPIPTVPPNTAPPPDGIRDEGQSFGPASTLVPTNEWNHTNDQGTLTVVAGSRGTDDRGGVVVVHWTKDGRLDEVHPYYAPAGVPALRITREVPPSQLGLMANNGRVVYFNYDTRAFSTP